MYMKRIYLLLSPPPWGGWVGLVLVFVLVFTCCRTKLVHVPVETVKTEYRDKVLRDSVHHYDSVFLKMKGDTVWLEKYKYLYRDRLVRDSVFKTDSVQVPYPVEVEREVNRLTSFQAFQVWCGRILLLALLGGVGVWWCKKYI